MLIAVSYTHLDVYKRQLFYLAIIVVHFIVGFLIAKPLIGLRASSVATNFVDRAITPKLQAEAESTNHERAAVESARNAIKAKVDDLQNQIAQAQTEEEQLRKEIEEKKNSDICEMCIRDSTSTPPRWSMRRRPTRRTWPKAARCS